MRWFIRVLGLGIGILALIRPAFTQQGPYVFLEFGGSGGLASINIEHPVYTTQAFALDMRYGFSLAPIDRNNGTNLIFPVMVHGIWGPGSHKLDLGVGQTLSISTRGNFFLTAPMAAGYRYQPKGKYYFIRLSYTPLLSYLVDIQWQHWGGITFGYSLR